MSAHVAQLIAESRCGCGNLLVWKPCWYCDGTGQLTGIVDHPLLCSVCDGAGQYLRCPVAGYADCTVRYIS